MKPTAADEAVCRRALARYGEQLGRIDAAGLTAIVASLRTNAEVFVVQLRGAGWAWDHPATGDAAQGVICQMLEESVAQLHDLSPGQMEVVRRRLIPELALATAQEFEEFG